MLGPFATASRLTPTHQVSLPVLSRAACASMSTTTTTTRDRGDRYMAPWNGPNNCDVCTYLGATNTVRLQYTLITSKPPDAGVARNVDGSQHQQPTMPKPLSGRPPTMSIRIPGLHLSCSILLLPFIKTVDKTQLHTQNSNSRSHKIQQSVFTHNSRSINNLNMRCSVGMLWLEWGKV